MYIYIIYNIYNIYIYVYQKDKEIKPSYQILREFHVNVRTNIQPVLNELTSRYTYGIAYFFKPSVQSVLILRFIKSFVKKLSI